MRNKYNINNMDVYSGLIRDDYKYIDANDYFALNRAMQRPHVRCSTQKTPLMPERFMNHVIYRNKRKPCSVAYHIGKSGLTRYREDI